MLLLIRDNILYCCFLNKYEEYSHFFEISNLVHYEYRFEITYLKHSHLVIQMKPLPKTEKRDPTYLPDDYVSLPDRIKNSFLKIYRILKKLKKK